MKRAFCIVVLSFIWCTFSHADNSSQSCVPNGAVLYSDPSESFILTGHVLFQDTHEPINQGKVKAVSLDKETFDIIIEDSAIIQPGGYYILHHIRQDSIFIVAYPDDEDEDAPNFVPTYYPSTIKWQYASRLYPSASLSNIDLEVYRAIKSNGIGIISGGVFKALFPYTEGIKDAVIYAKLQNGYRNFSLSGSDGYYYIDSLPMGDYQIIVDRIGYYGVSRLVSFQTNYIDTINFFLESILSVKPPKTYPVPTSHKLNQNFPNPFNPSTYISFDIPENEPVKLVIYDIRGKEVIVLMNSELKAGSYKVMWDASVFSGGVYFYELTAGNFKESKKMILLK